MTDHREIIAGALAEFRFDLDERGRPIIGPVTIERMADAIIADLDKRGLCIVPSKANRNMIEAMRVTTKWGNGMWGDQQPSAETWAAAVAAAPK